MKVYLPEYSGFCPGVKLAEKNLFDLKAGEKNKKIYVLGRLIHNKQYIEFLNKEGVKTVDKAVDIPENSLAVIRTHGLDRREEEKLRRGLKVVDLTCGKVKQLQRYIESHAREGYSVVITGKKDHPEVLGLMSYAEDAYIIEDSGDIKRFIHQYRTRHKPFNKKGCRKILVVSQTTGKRSLFEEAAEVLKQNFSGECEIKVHDSICSITSLRELESVKLQKKADVTFVLGDPQSSNAGKLYQILKEKNSNTFFVENLSGLISIGLPLNTYRAALVVSSSSTPPFIEKEVAGFLLGI